MFPTYKHNKKVNVGTFRSRMLERKVWFSLSVVSQTQQNITEGRQLLDNTTDMPHSSCKSFRLGSWCCLQIYDSVLDVLYANHLRV